MGWSILLILRSSDINAETVKITTGEWKPLISEEFKHGGVVLHIVREAFKRKGITVEIKFFPWTRAEKYVEIGSWDAMAVTSSRHSTAGKTYLYSDTVYLGEDVVFYRKNKPIFGANLADLEGLTFGAVFSYDYTPDYQKALAEGKIKQVLATEAQQLFLMLAAERFDVFIMDKKAGIYTYNTEFGGILDGQISYLENPISKFEYSVRFSDDGEKNQRLIKIFNTSLKEMRESGLIDRYYNDFEKGYYLQP